MLSVYESYVAVAVGVVLGSIILIGATIMLTSGRKMLIR